MKTRFGASGDYRERVQVQYPVEVVDGTYGDTQFTYTTIGMGWAKIEPVTGDKTFMGQQLRPEITHKVEMRFRSDITVLWRLLLQKKPSRAINLLHVFAEHEFRGKLIMFGKEIVLT